MKWCRAAVAAGAGGGADSGEGERAQDVGARAAAAPAAGGGRRPPALPHRLRGRPQGLPAVEARRRVGAAPAPPPPAAGRAGAPAGAGGALRAHAARRAGRPARAPPAGRGRARAAAPLRLYPHRARPLTPAGLTALPTLITVITVPQRHCHEHCHLPAVEVDSCRYDLPF